MLFDSDQEETNGELASEFLKTIRLCITTEVKEVTTDGVCLGENIFKHLRCHCPLRRHPEMTARLSLAQQIALLEETAPVDLDPEDVHARDFHSEGPKTDPAAREHYFAVGPSSIRKQYDSISDPKYDGVRTSRQQLMEESGEEEDMGSGSEGSGSEVEDEDILGHHDVQVSSGVEEAEASDEDRGSAESEQEGEVNEARPRRERNSPARGIEDDEPTNDLSATLRKKREEDKKKGKAVSRQISLWDSLLDARIRIQKSVVAANRLPPPLHVKEYLKDTDCRESVNNMLKEAAALSEEIFQLQEYLLATNESITPPPRKRRKLNSDEDAPVNYDRWLQDATYDASALEEVYHPHLVQTLAKWSSKIQAVAPSVLLPSNRGAFSKGSQHTKTVLQLIDETLGDTSKILARTQVRRSKGVRIGQTATPEEEEPEHDPNVFDDTDFYQQLLRDIIDARGNASGGADDWLVAQKQKKAKKKVDTKASKGRKLRYETHEKLQHFMAPVPAVAGWHEEQIDELFASLLGKGFEVAGQGTEDTADGEALCLEESRLDEALKGGFRVFG